MSEFIDRTGNQYNSAIRQFIDWGGTLPCDTGMVLEFIEDMGSIGRVDRIKASSLRVYRSALKRWHEEARFPDPTMDKSIERTLNRLASIERQNGIRKEASRFITPEEAFQVVTLLVVMSDTAKSRKERLVTAIALMAGHRSGMIANIMIDDMMNLGVPGANIVINTPAFKTDAEDPTVIPYTGAEFCPASWIRAHIAEYDITEGYLFPSTASKSGCMSRHTVNDITKRILKLAGITGGILTATSFRKTMATLSAMKGVDAMAIAAQGSWSSVDTINKNYVSKALALQGHAPLAVLSAIDDARKAIDIELALVHQKQRGIEQLTPDTQESFSEMRRGFWDVIFHTDLTIEEKRGFASYFRAANKSVVAHGGKCMIELFNRTCEDYGYRKLIIGSR